jgi:hypothetical protein
MSITYGYSELITDVDTSEPITVSDVKASYLSHSGLDTEIERLITSCRKAVEKRFSKSLTEKTASVLWKAFYADIPLPYCPVSGIVTVTDLQGIVVESSLYSVDGVGGYQLFTGNFPNGVKLEYTTAAIEDTNINQLLIDSVKSCLEQDMTVQEAITKHFRNASF